MVAFDTGQRLPRDGDGIIQVPLCHQCPGQYRLRIGIAGIAFNRVTSVHGGHAYRLVQRHGLVLRASPETGE